MTSLQGLSDMEFSVNIPYNLERIFYIYSNGDKQKIRSVMKDFESKGSAEIPQELMKNIKQVIIVTY
ncbi:hypothetical protein Anas_06049 [Armadillidium nasatum]|uniref:Uncharacterized protein n=1 Tax=Armadillidium nasatum TaxID=96803 RepID=A0A5N5SL57_9CRUS|nr:hypothetical protein Anas_06049 [Armadillidium nasatum]